MDRQVIVNRLRQLDPLQWTIVGAIVLVVIVLAALVGPSFVPKPAPVPQRVPETAATQAPTPNVSASTVPTSTRDDVLAALERDGIAVTDPSSVKVTFEGDKSHVQVYGRLGGKFQAFRYVEKEGAWLRQ